MDTTRRPDGSSAHARLVARWMVIAATLAASAGGIGPAIAQGGGSFVQDDLSALVLGEGDAPPDAELTDTSGFEDVEGALEATIIGGARAEGLQAAFTNNFIPWSSSRDLQSTAMLFPDESTANRALSNLAQANDMSADDLRGEEGASFGTVYNAGGDQWVLAQLWRRGNVLLFLLMMEPAPDVPFSDADLSLADEMDAKAVALIRAKAAGPEDAGTQPPEAGTEDDGIPFGLIAAIVAGLLILGLAVALFVVIRRRPTAAPGAPAAAAPVESPAEGPAGATAPAETAPQAAAVPAATTTAPGTVPAVKYCTSCGTREEELDAKFCQSCGTPFG